MSCISCGTEDHSSDNATQVIDGVEHLFIGEMICEKCKGLGAAQAPMLPDIETPRCQGCGKLHTMDHNCATGQDVCHACGKVQVVP